MKRSLHCTYLPGNRWALNDTYPDKGRLQRLYLYEVSRGGGCRWGTFCRRRNTRESGDETIIRDSGRTGRRW